MAIRLLCEGGSIVIQSGPTRDLVDVTSQTDKPLRRIFGSHETIKQAGRQYRVRLNRDRLDSFFSDVFERYGS